MLNARGPRGESQAVFAFKLACNARTTLRAAAVSCSVRALSSPQMHFGTVSAQRTSCRSASVLVTGLA